MRFLVTISDGVYGETVSGEEVSAEWLEKEINCALDDAYSPHIKVEEVGGNG
jgi:hypothetical protein